MNILPVKKGKGNALPFFLNLISGTFQNNRFLNTFIMTLLLSYSAAAQAPSPLPAIARLDSKDTVFKQYLLDVESARRVLFLNRQNPLDQAAEERIASSMTIYSYTPREEDELIGISARCNIPYAALASLNRFSHMEDMVSGKVMLLPSVPGIFIPEAPKTDLEQLLFSARSELDPGTGQREGIILAIPREGKTERFRFIPGDDFSPTERIFFLNRGFHFPLEHFQVSSFYGPRTNPVTGKFSIHRGLDLAAPEGAEVYAVRNGTVTDLGVDPVLGKYVIISHDNNWVSFYGHLSSIETTLNAEVQSGKLIARVGSTGQSTGPHLHFELRQNGQSRDPARLLGLFKGTAGR